MFFQVTTASQAVLCIFALVFWVELFTALERASARILDAFLWVIENLAEPLGFICYTLAQLFLIFIVVTFISVELTGDTFMQHVDKIDL